MVKNTTEPATDVKTTSDDQDLLVEQEKDPNTLLHDFLEENSLKLTVEAVVGDNPFIGTGFILTDKPLLKVSVSYK